MTGQAEEKRCVALAERLQKLIAAAGLCSRRTAEEWIAEDRVADNGEHRRFKRQIQRLDGKRLRNRPEIRLPSFRQRLARDEHERQHEHDEEKQSRQSAQL